MIITRTHILGWTCLAIAAVTIALDAMKTEPMAAPAPAQVAAAPADDGMLPAAGNLYPPGKHLYFGQHDRIYRGQIIQFVETDRGEAAVLIKDGKTELMLRKDIAIRDFWVKAP